MSYISTRWVSSDWSQYLPRFHLWDQPQQVPTLPVELWTTILMITVNSYCKYYDNTSSITFPRFLFDWGTQNHKPNNQWRKLRLVCRLWSLILDPKWTPDIVARHMGHVLEGKDIRILRVVGNGRRWREYYNIQRHLEDINALVMESVTTLIFDEEVFDEQVRIKLKFNS